MPPKRKRDRLLADESERVKVHKDPLGTSGGRVVTVDLAGDIRRVKVQE